MNENNQEKTYSGLLGLDNIHPAIKLINFSITIAIGAGIAWIPTFRPLTSLIIRYDFWPPSLPLVFTYGLPVGLVSLWLRLTGIKWRWGILASILSLILPFLAYYIFAFVFGMMFDE